MEEEEELRVEDFEAFREIRTLFNKSHQLYEENDNEDDKGIPGTCARPGNW